MFCDTHAFEWNRLSDELQLALSAEALRRAVQGIAGQAECLAGEMEAGGLADRGGPDALRLLAALIRESGRSFPLTVGTA
jgi:Mor family transcriptional regulator